MDIVFSLSPSLTSSSQNLLFEHLYRFRKHLLSLKTFTSDSFYSSRKSLVLCMSCCSRLFNEEALQRVEWSSPGIPDPCQPRSQPRDLYRSSNVLVLRLIISFGVVNIPCNRSQCVSSTGKCENHLSASWYNIRQYPAHPRYFQLVLRGSA